MRFSSSYEIERLRNETESYIKSLVSKEIGVSVVVDNTRMDEFAVIFSFDKVYMQYSIKMLIVQEIGTNDVLWKNILIYPLLCELAKELWLKK